MGINIITNDIPNLSNNTISSINFFVDKNCSHYYFLNYIRITNGNVSDAISLYHFDEDLRKVVLKYILRLEVQMKKDLIDSVILNQGDTCFWNVPSYYNPSYTTVKKGYASSLFDIMVRDINYLKSKKNFSLIGPEDERCFYCCSFGKFIEIYKNLHFSHKSIFNYKYYGISSNSTSVIYDYLNSIRSIRNRCCHSNHIVSFKMINELGVRTLPIIGAYKKMSEFEKCLCFINNSLDNKTGMREELLFILDKYEKTWCKYKQLINKNTYNIISSFK